MALCIKGGVFRLTLGYHPDASVTFESRLLKLEACLSSQFLEVWVDQSCAYYTQTALSVQFREALICDNLI